jgi:hypothetical protein
VVLDNEFDLSDLDWDWRLPFGLADEAVEAARPPSRAAPSFRRRTHLDASAARITAPSDPPRVGSGR